MDILIYGAGAVGCYLGAHLALAGHAVTLLGREGLAAAVQREGLTLRLADGSEHTLQDVRVVTSVADAFRDTRYDWIALTVKAYDVPAAAFEMLEHCSEPPPVAAFQNGVGTEINLSSIVGGDRVVAATLTTPVAMPAAGIVQEEKRRGVALAADSAGTATVEAALRETTLPVEIVATTETLKWSKLLLNMVANAIPAILDMTPQEVYSDAVLFDLEWAALREALWVMELNDISATNLPGAPAGTLARLVRWMPRALLRPLLRNQVVGGRGDKLPSLLLDLRQDKRETEIAWLNGAVVQAASAQRRLAPINHALALTLSDIAAGRMPWEAYRGNRELLLTTIHAAQGMPDHP